MPPAPPGVLMAHPALAYPAMLLLVLLGIYRVTVTGHRLAKLATLLVAIALFMLGARELLAATSLNPWFWLTAPLWTTVALGFIVTAAAESAFAMVAALGWLVSLAAALSVLLNWVLGPVGLAMAHDTAAGFGASLVLVSWALRPPPSAAKVAPPPATESTPQPEAAGPSDEAEREARLKAQLSSEQAQETADKYTRE